MAWYWLTFPGIRVFVPIMVTTMAYKLTPHGQQVFDQFFSVQTATSSISKGVASGTKPLEIS